MVQDKTGSPPDLFLRLHVEGDPLMVRDGLRRAFQQSSLSDLGAEDRDAAEIVLAEILNNIVEHAAPGGPALIELWLTRTGRGIFCRIEDDGKAMPDATLPPSAPPVPAALAEGGYGWHLIRSLTENLRYQRLHGRNRLTFIFATKQ